MTFEIPQKADLAIWIRTYLNDFPNPDWREILKIINDFEDEYNEDSKKFTEWLNSQDWLYGERRIKS